MMKYSNIMHVYLSPSFCIIPNELVIILLEGQIMILYG